MISELYRLIEEANESREMDLWHASSIAQCPRSLYFQRKGVPALEKPGAGKILRWRAGHIIEGEIRPHLEKMYPDLMSNVRLQNKTLTGEYDNYIPSEKRIIEVKSVHDWAMRKKDKKAILRDDQPYLSHELQNHAYVKLLRERGFEVEEITYLYITLGGLMCEYTTPVKDELLRNVNARLLELNESWERQEPPACICEESHPLWKSTMQYCPYRTNNDCCNLNLLKEE